MIHIPESSSSIIKTIGIDPGTTMLGVSIMEINLDTRLIERTTAFSLNAKKLPGNNILFGHYGDRHSRIYALVTQLSKVLDEVSPHAVIAESPFFNPTRPDAYSALVELTCALRSMLFEYDCLKPLYQVPPSNVKNAVGARGGAEKITIRDSVLKLKEINYTSQEELESLDEHAIDSIAVNYWYYLNYLRRRNH